MHDYRWPVLVTLGVMVLLIALAAYVGKCREKYNAPAPAMAGDPAFMRAFRVHMNTVENAVVFLPVLWLFAVFVSSVWAGLLGAAWIAARIWYVFVYIKDPAKRTPPFVTALAALAVLFLGTAWVALTG